MPDNDKNTWSHSHTLAAIGLGLQLVLVIGGGLLAYSALVTKMEVINTRLVYMQLQLNKVEKRTEKDLGFNYEQ